MFGLVGWILGLIALATPIAAFVAYRRTIRLELEIRVLRARLELLAGAGSATAPAPSPFPTVAREALPPEPQIAETPEEEISAGETPADEPPETAAAAATPAAPARPGLEQSLTSRWLVWLGGVTLALGAVFLVKYSIDAGLLRPATRIVIGVLFGIVLIAAGELLRRRPMELALAAVNPSQVPPALTAAGVATLFASIYAAYGLYDMIAPLLAFLLLAAVALVAVGLALLQGPFIAVLGLIGGYLTPALVSTDNPQAAALFPYLLILALAALALMRQVGAWWLGWFTLVGALIWPAIWLAAPWQAGDGLVLGPYLILLAAAFLLIRVQVASDDGETGVWHVAFSTPALLIPWLAAVLATLLMLALVRVDGYGTAALAFAIVIITGLLIAARRDARFDSLAIVAAVFAAALMALWHLPRILTLRPAMYMFDGRVIGEGVGPVVPPELMPFLSVGLILLALTGGGGFVALWGARRPAVWAGISAGTPAVLLALAYWRIKHFEIDLGWAAAAVALAAVMVAAAARTVRYRDAPGLTAATGAYAAGVAAALSLALAMSLENAWLTAAIALQVPALAWIEDRLDLPPIRRLALVLVAIVLVRLVLNYQVLDYPVGSLPGLNWILYGYGVPAAAFYRSARWFRARADDLLVAVLEAAALAFAVLLVTLELRHLMSPSGSLTGDYRLSEQALQASAWLSIAVVLFARNGDAGRPVGRWAWRSLGTAATVQVLLVHCLVSNPLVTGAEVGDWAVVNVLLIAFALPAALYAWWARLARQRGMPWLAGSAGGVALFLAFVWLSLEVRHAFQGTRLDSGTVSDAEWYSYSIAWLAFAAVLLALGLWRRVAPLRYASLVLVLVTVAKVFVIDMSALTGGYRALSFIGLGLALVGVGWLYRRYVFVPQPAPGPDSTE